MKNSIPAIYYGGARSSLYSEVIPHTWVLPTAVVPIILFMIFVET